MNEPGKAHLSARGKGIRNMPKVNMAPWLQDGEKLSIGDAVEVEAALLRSLAVLKDSKGNVQARANGIMLADDRRSVRIRIGDLPVTFAISMTIMRDPLTDAEIALCDEREADGKRTKAQKQADAKASTDALRHAVKAETIELAQAQARATALEAAANANTLRPVLDTIKAFAEAGVTFAARP